MNVRSALTTVLACLIATAGAIASVDRMCTWLVDDAGSMTRNAVLLANAPILGGHVPASLDTTRGSDEGRRHRRSPSTPSRTGP